jgi:hypothetical protein
MAKYVRYDSYGNYYDQETVSTAFDGSVQVPCLLDRQGLPSGSYEVQVYTRSGTVQVNNPNFVSHFWGDFTWDCGYPVEVFAESNASHVFTNMNRTISASEAFFSYRRPFIEVDLVSDTISGYCPVSGFGGICNRADYVRIGTRTSDRYGPQVWGTNGVFVQAHEYGHAFHEKALGGFYHRYYSGCGYHDWTLPTSLGCALIEGFASYFAVATRRQATGNYEYWVETNAFYPGGDGSIVEGPVASFLYDITDSNWWGLGTQGAPVGQRDEHHDNIVYSGSYVAGVIASCQVRQNGVWTSNTGIDHLVYCFERQVDPTVTGSSTYFHTRNPDPTEQNQTGTPDTAIRALWLKNLYWISL